MKKRIFGTLLMGALVVSSVSMFTSCKDYDDDIKTNETAIAAVKADLSALQTTLTQQLSDAEARLNTAIAAKADAATVTNLAAEVAALKTQLNEAKTALQGDITAMQTAIAELTGKVDGLAGLAGLGDALNAETTARTSADANLQSQIDAAAAAAAANLALQQAALEQLRADLTALQNQGVPVQTDYQSQIDAINTQLAAIQASIMSAEEVASLRQQMTDASTTVSSFSANINVLNLFVERLISSITLSPSKFYGGIEGIDIFAFTPWKENMKDQWEYFTRKSDNKRVDLSERGFADYHISPANVDLSGAKVKFFTRTADIVEPAVGNDNEQTRAVSDNGRVTPIYESTDDLLQQGLFASNGVLTVPFKASVSAIKSDLDNQKKANITALQLIQKNAEGKDTVITSDYAMIYPSLAEQLLICDKTFDDADDAVRHQDVIGKNNTAVSSFHLHRNLSYLALSNTSATHEVEYNGSFDITAVLETHFVDIPEAIVDTADVTPHTAAALNGRADGDASVLASKCHKLTPERLAQLGLHYEINLANYYLGTNKTSESAHMELITNEAGHVIAYPRNVTAAGATITGQTANQTAVGRMPIACIELKTEDGTTVTFAWMKFLIVRTVEPIIENSISVDFTLPKDYYADCRDMESMVTWSQIEHDLYDQKLGGITKADFDARYEYEYYKNQVEQDINDVTKYIHVREGVHYFKDGNTYKRYRDQAVSSDGVKLYKHGNSFAKQDSIGTVIEQWNESAQQVEDATTHILKWKLTTDDFWAVYKWLKTQSGGLKYNANDITNGIDISTWVRYANRSTANGEPAVYVQLVIPAGKIHFAKGNFSETKTLTYWFNLNSKTNAEAAANAKEVRVSVPVPVPDVPATAPTILGGANCVDAPAPAEVLTIFNDNLLERTEFLKDLHDFFRNGRLTASIADRTNFPTLAGGALTPEFEFTLPSTVTGNATFNADANGQWKVMGISGAEYTLKLANNNKEIRIVKKNSTPITPNQILVCINPDNDGIQSVVRYHQGQNQDDILNYRGHDDLGELETFTAYIMINTPDACAPVEFDDMWFNVRFLRPLDLDDPNGFRRQDARNDWQYVDLSKVAIVRDWRNYYGDPLNRNQGIDQDNKFDFIYYQVELDADETNFRTDAGFGTATRKPIADDAALGDNLSDIFNLNTTTDANYAISNLWKTSEVQGLLVEKVLDTTGTPCPANVKSTIIRYKNNSGVTGGFRMFLPIRMTYVFGQFVQNAQAKYVTIEIKQSHNQEH